MTFKEFEILNEIGDAKIKTFPWKLKTSNDEGEIYTIESEKTKYELFFWNRHGYLIDYISDSFQVDPEEIGPEAYDSKMDRLLKEMKDVRLFDIVFTEKNTRQDYAKMSGMNELYQLMSTITEIIKQFIKENKVDLIYYSGVKGKKDKDDVSRRAKLYQEYLKKNIKTFDNATYEAKGDSTVIVLNKNWKEHTKVIFEIFG